jgi:deazaflavin-dependent oxidoreductase (nitroreductase family)
MGKMQRLVEQSFIRSLVRLGLAPRAFAVIETKGRKSGRPRQTPVGVGLDGRTAWLVAVRDQSDYVKNLVAEPRVRLKVRRRWYSGRAEIVEGDDGMARRRAIDATNGLAGRLDGVLFRRLADRPCTVRIDLDD